MDIMTVIELQVIFSARRQQLIERFVTLFNLCPIICKETAQTLQRTNDIQIQLGIPPTNE